MTPLDCRTPADRERLDTAVLEVLPFNVPSRGYGLTRGQVAEALGLDTSERKNVKMVSASLMRQGEPGPVRRGGSANAYRYWRVA
jgi:hypothetical protein